MRQRFITSLILVAITAGVIFSYPLCGITVVFLTFVGLYEFYYMVEKKGVQLFKIFGLLAGILIPITIYFHYSVKEGSQFLAAVAAMFLLFLLELFKKETHQAVLSISATVFGVLYIPFCFSFLLRIRQMEEGLMLVTFLLLVTKASDIGAYLWGKTYGKTPFLERVSPKKTLEGAAGGFFTSLAVGILGALVIKTMSFWECFYITIIVAIVSQLGDLFESLIKRDCQVKDSGKLIPGMGGVLDVIDSIIFTAPIFYLYILMMRQPAQVIPAL